MKIYNLVIYGGNWFSSTLYTNLDSAINEVNKMVEGQKYLEGQDNVYAHEIKDYEALPSSPYMNFGERKYAVETRTKFMGEMTTTWRVIFEQDVK